LMRGFAQWVPRLAYGTVVILIAWHVISFWMGYFNQLQNVLQ